MMRRAVKGSGGLPVPTRHRADHENTHEFDSGLTDPLILAEIAASPSPPRDAKVDRGSLRAKRGNLVMDFENPMRPGVRPF
jgi:hypothetical protein